VGVALDWRARRRHQNDVFAIIWNRSVDPLTYCIVGPDAGGCRGRQLCAGAQGVGVDPNEALRAE